MLRIALALALIAGPAMGITPRPASAAPVPASAPAAAASVSPHAARDTSDLGAVAKARVLHRWAEDALLDPSIESRRRAERDLKEAIRLDPTNADHWITLGQVYLLGEYAKQGRDCFDRAVLLAPRDPRTHMERGRTWKRDWTRWLDTLAFEHALADFDTVTKLRPNGSVGWLALTPMLYERGDLAGAARAAERALAGRPRVVEAGLAVAYTAWRRGDSERADSLFRETIPRLQPDLRALFTSAAPILGRTAGGGAPARAARPTPTAQGSISGPPPEESASLGDATPAPPTPPEVWAGIDPDPTTPENETRLEFWSRVAHAYFVFWDPLQPVLDARAELYIRYGPPRSIEINPAGVPLSFKPNVISSGRSTSLAEYPMGVVRWNYPDLGMRVVLDDRSLHGQFAPAVTRDFEMGSVPNPAIMARRGDLMALDGGRAVFPTLPPRELRIEVAGLAARFESATGPRLFAQVQAIGSPSDTLASRWVVLDAASHEVARGGGRLAVSACDPSSRQLAEVSRDLPPGQYRLALSVRGSGHRKGLFRAALDLAAPDTSLGLSDVVLSCGDPTQFAGGPSVRLDANVESRVSGAGPLTVYFEVYRLAPASDGMAHFEVEYAVRRLSEAPGRGGKRPQREPVLLSSSMRPEDQPAGVRRQFVRVPINPLTPGRYELEIRVRDLVAGAQVARTIAFDRE